MRRTRERFFTTSNTSRGPVDLPALPYPSGLLVFYGEDPDFTSRTKYMQKTHRALFDKQVKAKRCEMLAAREKEVGRERDFVRASSRIGAREEENRRQYRLKLEGVKTVNLALARERSERMVRERREEMEEERRLMQQLTSRRTRSKGSLLWR